MAAVGLSVVSYFVVWARAQDWAGNLVRKQQADMESFSRCSPLTLRSAN